MRKAAVYVRVSGANKSRQGDAGGVQQNLESQVQTLRELVASRGWTLHRIHSDKASGVKEPVVRAYRALTDAPQPFQELPKTII